MQALKEILRTLDNLGMASSLLSWDEHVFMPPEGSEERGKALATLSVLQHKLGTSSEFESALQKAEKSLKEDSSDTEKAIVREARRSYDRAKRVPAELVGEISEHSSAIYAAWVKAKSAGTFLDVLPLIQKSLTLTRKYCDIFSEFEHPLDVLIDESEPGMTVKQLKPLFATLRGALTPMVQEVCSREQSDPKQIQGDFPVAAQSKFTNEVIKEMGFNFARGRQDTSPHPFCSGLNPRDVRITTRYDTSDLFYAFLSTIHEVGHAMYEQGVDINLTGTGIGHGASLGIHESQSRLWENIVARQAPFWTWLLPKIQKAFPAPFSKLDVDTVVNCLNHIERSLIRTESDELTYNLHIMIRFDIEVGFLEGSIKPNELRDLWNDRYESDLGVKPENDAQGILQDLHWFGGLFGGYFHSYTIGNILSAQIYEAAQKATPNLESSIAAGNFSPLLSWLRTNIHQHGKVYMPSELVKRATGSEMTIDPYVKYLSQKFRVSI